MPVSQSLSKGSELVSVSNIATWVVYMQFTAMNSFPHRFRKNYSIILTTSY